MSSHEVSYAVVAPAGRALRRVGQAAMIALTSPFLLLQLWRAVTFPQDDRSWLVIAGLAAATALPLAMWWYERAPGRAARATQIAVSGIAVVLGLVLAASFSARAGWVATHPGKGPMSTEVLLFGLAYCALCIAAGASLMFAPVVLDRVLLSSPARRRFLRAGAVVLLLVVVIACSIGPRLEGYQ